MATLIPLLFELLPGARITLAASAFGVALVGLSWLQAEMRRAT